MSALQHDADRQVAINVTALFMILVTTLTTHGQRPTIH